tara:strand:- start:6868 stop:7500 length:633 start_codon:yes stop_codon:yes gene_type:complete
MSNTHKSPYWIAMNETIMNSDKYITESNKTESFSQISGYEPDYNPDVWNLNYNIKENHNCYAYAINKLAPNRQDKSQPGYWSNFSSLRNTDYSCATFLKRLKKDIPGLYITDFKTKCKPGFSKAFLAVAKNNNNNTDYDSDKDYHFYRQDSSKFWSHKPGRTSATNLDASKQKIINPLIADRKYDYFNYSYPCFFFCVNTKLSSLSSSSK